MRPQERSERTGKLICRCGEGYASDIDLMCFTCRSHATPRHLRDKGKSRPYRIKPQNPFI